MKDKMGNEIPKELAHLKIDERGYVIPFFVAFVDNKPDFRLLSTTKQDLCIDKKLCAICGKKLLDKIYFFLSGPHGLNNRISSDPAMHKVCAEYSLVACPHMYLQKAQRRDVDIEKSVLSETLLTLDKPTELFLIRADKYWKDTMHGQTLIRYRFVSAEVYNYIDGKLKRQS
jgi:hypothetical protein